MCSSTKGHLNRLPKEQVHRLWGGSEVMCRTNLPGFGSLVLWSREEQGPVKGISIAVPQGSFPPHRRQESGAEPRTESSRTGAGQTRRSPFPLIQCHGNQRGSAGGCGAGGAQGRASRPGDGARPWERPPLTRLHSNYFGLYENQWLRAERPVATPNSKKKKTLGTLLGASLRGLVLIKGRFNLI